MYLASYELDGSGTFVRAADARTLRGLLGCAAFRADGNSVHVASFDPDRPIAPAEGVHTTVEAVLGWTDGALPPAVDGTPLAAREAQVGGSTAFLREVKRLFAQGAGMGVIDVGQAAAIVRAATLAVTGAGPAGRREGARAEAILALPARR